MPENKYNRKQRTISPRSPIYPVGPSIAYIPMANGLFSLVDWDDAAFISRWNWSVTESRGILYARRRIPKNCPYKKAPMHSLLLSTDGDITPDHKNGNGLDNRRSSNLRYASKTAQCWNRGPSSRNSSGIKGVYWNKQVNKWHVTCTANKVRHYLGQFDSKEDAAQVIMLAAYIYHGEFARLA